MAHKLRKMWRWLIYSLRLGRGLRGKLVLVYMVLRWTLINYVSGSLRRLLPFPERIHIRFHGKDLAIYAAGDTSFPYLFYEVFIGEDYRLDLRTPPSCIIDAGAHYGLASLYFSCLYPDAVIHALEPCSKNFHFLQMNARGFKNLHVHRVGLYSRSGTQRLYLQPSSGEHSLVAAGHRYEDIPTTTLGEFMISEGIPHVDLLKIDVEGAEEAVLTTPGALDHVDRVTGEIHFKLCSWPRIRQSLDPEFRWDIKKGAADCGVLYAVSKRLA
jgi:FkbM family methyltransferase